MVFVCLFLGALLSISEAENIILLKCKPPDSPVWGSYGPSKNDYLPGDVIHYFCDIDTYIGGNFYRKCLDTGTWSGVTPMCDAPTKYKTTTQTTDFDENSSSSDKAVDGIRTTCSETIGGVKEEWSGTFEKPGDLIRVMLFLPKGPASFEIVLVKQNGDEVICGSHSRNIDRYDWIIDNCPDSNNKGTAGIKIRSLTTDPVKICEMQAYVLTSPKCGDPDSRIENGRLKLNRKTAILVCDYGFIRSPDAKLECLREGEWTRKTLYCNKPETESNNRETWSGEKQPSGPDTQPNRKRDKLQSQ